MMGVFHEGELAVQARAGVGQMAARIGGGIRPELSPGARDFLEEQTLVVVSAQDAERRLWASLLSGPAGFVEALDAHTVTIAAALAPDDPLAERLASGEPVELGLLAIDLATRRRIRVNGTAEGQPDGTIRLSTREVFGNCPKYIQARDLSPAPVADVEPAPRRRGNVFTPAQQSLIRRADTAFLATAHPSGRADASHRGGPPGFLAVVDEATLLLPDYQGNMMFQSLGNIEANPQVGLLILDFADGTLLQITGEARIIWDQTRLDRLPGAERAVEIWVAEVYERQGRLPWLAGTVRPSPFNPKEQRHSDENGA